MIRVTRINGEELVINAGLIEFVEATPDTVIALATGRKTLVRETIEDVIARVVSYEGAVSVAGRCARHARWAAEQHDALEDEV